MQTQSPTPDRMGITGRIAQLHESYRNAFHAEFDPAAFRADDFYAFQVLEKAITKGTPTLRDAAQEMQDLRLAGIEEAEPETDPDAETDTETPDMLATSELIQSSEPLDAPEADEPLLPESFLAAPHEAAPQPAGPDLPESILEPSEAQLIAAQAHAHAAAISAARMHTALAAARAKALARAAALETGGTPEGAAPEGEGPEGGATAPGAPAAAAALDAAPAAPDTLGAGGAAVPTLPGTDPVMGADPDLLLTADAADAMPQLPGQERRAAAARGHVRLGYKEIVLLSQMRVQYRKVFGSFFEIFDFTGNDLYARSLLSLCLESGNSELSSMAQQFLDAQGKPRFHRRQGSADLDFD